MNRNLLHHHHNLGEKIADRVAATMGSWRFIITQASIMAFWVVLNTVAWFSHFDSYPFILLNLAMSAQAAFATPLIMMSQNRQAAINQQRDDLEAQEVGALFENHETLFQINQQQLVILNQQTAIMNQQTEILRYLHASVAPVQS